MKLDATDLRILSSIAANARMTNLELAGAVNLAPSSCNRRLKLLEEAGIIAGYNAALDAKALGVEVDAYVNVSLRNDVDGANERFTTSLHDWPEVKSASLVTGKNSYILHVQARSLTHYSEFILSKLNKISSITEIQENLVLKAVKSSGSPLDLVKA